MSFLTPGRPGLSRRIPLALAAAFAAMVVAALPVTASALAGTYDPFPTDAAQSAVWAAVSPEGVDSTSVQLINTADGAVLDSLGPYSGSFNALAYYADANVLLALHDSQFIDTIPLNNTPILSVIDASGTISEEATLAAPTVGHGGTVLSYMAAVSPSGMYYLVGYRYTVPLGTVLYRWSTNTLRGNEVELVLGTLDVSADPVGAVSWDTVMDFSSSAACATHKSAFFGEILSGQVPQSMFQDYAYGSDGLLHTVMSGNDSTGDLLTTIDPATGVVTCTPMTGDPIAGMSGGVAFTPGYTQLMAIDLSNGNLYSVVGGVSTLVKTGGGDPIRGDMASNPYSAVTPAVTTTTTTTTTSTTTSPPSTSAPSTTSTSTTSTTATAPATAPTTTTRVPVTATTPSNSDRGGADPASTSRDGTVPASSENTVPERMAQTASPSQPDAASTPAALARTGARTPLLLLMAMVSVVLGAAVVHRSREER